MEKTYFGYDVHAWTKYLNNFVVDKNLSDEKMDEKEFHHLISLISEKYGNDVMICIENLKRNYNNGYIKDPEIPNINFAFLLKYLFEWENNSLLKETLIEIGGNCIQGITHRLLLLYFCKINNEIKLNIDHKDEYKNNNDNSNNNNANENNRANENNTEIKK